MSCLSATSFVRLHIAEMEAKLCVHLVWKVSLQTKATLDVITVNHHQAGDDLLAWSLLQEIKEVAEKRRSSDADLLTLSVAAPYVTRIAAELTYDYKDR